MAEIHTDKESSIDRAAPDIRDAHDAEHHQVLKADPTDEDSKLEVGLDASFPSSDAPASAAPGTGEPVPSSGYDEAAERRLQERRKRAYALWEEEGRPEGRHDAHWRAAGEDHALEPGTDPWIEGP